MNTLTPQEFVHRWRGNRQKERSASQSHFIDLCRVLDLPTPMEDDPTGETYAFERAATKTGGPTAGRRGWADVWKKDHFAWEYKGPRKNLDEAYSQLQFYRESLGNPPLLVVSDLRIVRVHTNFNNTVKRIEDFALDDLLNPERLSLLRSVWKNPSRFRSEETPEAVTEKAAREFARIAESLRKRGEDPDRAARFLIQILFCLFAEDVELLPDKLFSKLVGNTRGNPEAFTSPVRQLFGAMRTGGFFGADPIRRFNGGLFDRDEALRLNEEDLDALRRVCDLDWGSVEPAVLGTLFERSLDPAKRAQLGAHYTSKEDILEVVKPVLMAPLRRRWASVRARGTKLATRRDEARGGQRTRLNNELKRLLSDFTDEIASVNVLDPACGSGNFLYVSLKLLLDLEKDVVTFARDATGLDPSLPKVSPEQMHGVEIDEYAHELAAATVWIGHIQWLRENGFGKPPEPVLGQMQNILHMDAILGRDGEGKPVEPEWPEAKVIVGNPPFLGGKRLRAELQDGYVNDVFEVYRDRVPREADLVLYWFEKSRELIERGKVERAGLLATQAIRGGANRRVLQRIKQSGDVFFAQSDRKWIVGDAAVQVSMVGFDNGAETQKTLDGAPVGVIYANLAGDVDLTEAKVMPENSGIAFMGDTKGGPFDVRGDLAREMLCAAGNPNGKPNADVVRPWANGLDITRRPRDMWIVDFGTDTSLEDAALYEAPFEFVGEHVRPGRATNNRKIYRDLWWLHVEPRPAMRRALAGLQRFLGTPRVAKHRLFVWLEAATLPDSQIIVFASSDDYFFGVLHSRAHEVWARRMGTQLREADSGFRYTPTTCFETFPLPEPTEEDRTSISEAARRLDELRRNWLDPEGTTEAELKKLTLTNLYNARPTWLDNAHRRLDAAVFAAYDWPADISDEGILKNLLALNLDRVPSHSAKALSSPR